ncbi:MAG: hypothetical protein NZ455_11575 [Bacteroidia bacterium]|nr:hypothetical protein [Bacteroidia bacterium]MDW8347768.1 hypothetical protein [Bacteroidia bacterium]
MGSSFVIDGFNDHYIRVYEQKFLKDLKENTQIYFILIFNVLDVKVENQAIFCKVLIISMLI